MKLSRKAEYALLTMMDLSMKMGDGLARAGEIARRQGIPLKFLEQILIALREGGLVASRRGSRGGYLLAVSPHRISVGAVVRLVQGQPPPQSSSPVHGASRQDPGEAARMVLQNMMAEVDAAVSRQVEGVTIAELCVRVRARTGGEARMFDI